MQPLGPLEPYAALLPGLSVQRSHCFLRKAADQCAGNETLVPGLGTPSDEAGSEEACCPYSNDPKVKLASEGPCSEVLTPAAVLAV